MLCAPPDCNLAPSKPKKKPPLQPKEVLHNNHLYHSPNHLIAASEKVINGYIHITPTQFIQGLFLTILF
jgi:hypothetical protein